MNMSDVYDVKRINIKDGNIDLDLINVQTTEKLSVRFNVKQRPQKIKPIISTLKKIENDIVYDDAIYYNYSFNELHNGNLGDPIQLASIDAEDVMIRNKDISLPTHLQQIYEFKTVE